MNRARFAPFIYGMTVEAYCEGVRNNRWGGDREISALSEAYGVTICVIKHKVPKMVTHGEQFDGKRNGKIIYLAYYEVQYGDVSSHPLVYKLCLHCVPASLHVSAKKPRHAVRSYVNAYSISECNEILKGACHVLLYVSVHWILLV